MNTKTTGISEKGNQLVQAISFLLVAGFLATTLTSYFVSRSAVRAGIQKNELPLTSDNIYTEIQRDLIKPVFISALMSTNTFLRDWVIDGEKDQSKISNYLNDIKIKYNTVTSFFVSDKTRNYYHGDGKLKTVSENEPRDAWYFRVRNMPEPYEINVDPDMANKDTITIFINYRVRDYNGDFIGVIGVGLTLDFVKHLMENYNVKYGRNVYFIDRDGDVKFIGTTLRSLGDNVFRNKQAPDFKEEFEKAVETESGFYSYRKNGQLIHVNVRYISEFKLYLIVEQPEGAKLRDIFSTLLLNLILCSVVTVVILVLMTRTIRKYQQKIKTLEGIIPICMHCKEIRDEQGVWHSLEHYISERSDARFSHGICPKCIKKYYP